MLLEGKSLQKAMLLQKADSDSSLDSQTYMMAAARLPL